MRNLFLIVVLLILISCKQHDNEGLKSLNVSDVKDGAKWFFEESLVAVPLDNGFLSISKDDCRIKVWLLSNPEKKRFIDYKYEFYQSGILKKTVENSVDLIAPIENGFVNVEVADGFVFTIVAPHAIELKSDYKYKYEREDELTAPTN